MRSDIEEQFYDTLFKLITTHNEVGLHDYISKYANFSVSLSSFIGFTNRFFCNEKAFLKSCINLNGSGGSLVAKLNLTSIASIYVAVITGLNIAKTGSRANTGLCGSTDFFESIGLLYNGSQIHQLQKYHFAYYDYLCLSPWKKYKDILSINNNIASILKETIFFEYEAKKHVFGISSLSYRKSQNDFYYVNFPKELSTYYTDYKGKLVDEVITGDLWLDDNLVYSIDIPTYKPKNKDEILNQGQKLLYASSDNDAAIQSLRYSVSLNLLGLRYIKDINSGLSLFDNAYKNGLAGKLVDQIRLSFDSERNKNDEI